MTKTTLQRRFNQDLEDLVLRFLHLTLIEIKLVGQLTPPVNPVPTPARQSMPSMHLL
jgi:hypothetical protein